MEEAEVGARVKGRGTERGGKKRERAGGRDKGEHEEEETVEAGEEQRQALKDSTHSTVCGS